MPFVPFTVQRKGQAGTGFSASLKKTNGSTAALSFAIRESIAVELGLKDQDRVAVQLGEGEHHGLVRLRVDAAGTATVVRRVTGDAASPRGVFFAIALGHVPNFVNRSEAKKWCQVDVVEDGWIEVVLPSWADETGTRRARIAPPSAALLLAAPRPQRSLVASLAGDPPPGRSALDQRRREPTRGDARRLAEEREEAGHRRAERVEIERDAVTTERLARITMAFACSRREAMLVAVLLDGKTHSRDAIHAALYQIDPGDAPETKIIDVFVSKARKRLMTCLVEIETIRGVGFRMAPEMVARAMVLIDDASSRQDDERDLEELAAAGEQGE